MSECEYGRDNKVDDNAAARYDKMPTIDNVVTSVERRCTKWIETGDPSSIEEFMKGTLLELFPNGYDDSQTAEFLSCILNETSRTSPRILVHFETVRKERGARETSNNNENEGQEETDAGNKVLRRIQLQIMLRLHLWGRYGNRFLDLYAKSSLAKSTSTRRKKSKKQQLRKKTPEDLMLEDVTNILALAAFQLPPDHPFPDFVRSCLFSPPVHLPPPKAVEYIYDRFELQTPEQQEANENALSPHERIMKRKRSSLSNKSVSTTSTNSSSQGARQRNGLIPDYCYEYPKTSSIPGQIVTTNKENNDDALLSSSFLPKRVPLTAPTTKRRNSLLGDSSSGSRFVGSHFNTSLSNMNSLFRQVKTTKRHPNSNTNSKSNNKVGKAFSRPQQQPLTGLNKPPAAAVAAAAVECNAQKMLKRTKPAVKNNNNNHNHQDRIVVHETPCKQRAAVENRPAQRCTSLFVAETPVPPPPPASAFATTRRRPSVVNKNEMVGGANLVAQARRAIQARSERRR